MVTRGARRPEREASERRQAVTGPLGSSPRLSRSSRASSGRSRRSRGRRRRALDRPRAAACDGSLSFARCGTRSQGAPRARGKPSTMARRSRCDARHQGEGHLTNSHTLLAKIEHPGYRKAGHLHERIGQAFPVRHDPRKLRNVRDPTAVVFALPLNRELHVLMLCPHGTHGSTVDAPALGGAPRTTPRPLLAPVWRYSGNRSAFRRERPSLPISTGPPQKPRVSSRGRAKTSRKTVGPSERPPVSPGFYMRARRARI